MTEDELNMLKEEYLEIYYQIERDGADKLLEYLEKTDFFTAPASTKRHSAYEGGLCRHSINVYHRYVRLLEMEYGEKWKEYVSEESAAIIALLHDICKVNCYGVEMRNVKKDGVWSQEPFYKYSDPLPYGHGEKSVYMISGYMKLTREEAMAINWHMGAFDPRADKGLSDAYKRYPNALLFHLADYLAVYFDE